MTQRRTSRRRRQALRGERAKRAASLRLRAKLTRRQPWRHHDRLEFRAHVQWHYFRRY